MLKDMKPVRDADKILEGHMGVPIRYVRDALVQSMPDGSFYAKADYMNGISDGLEKFWVNLAQIVKNRKLKTKLVMDDNQ